MIIVAIKKADLKAVVTVAESVEDFKRNEVDLEHDPDQLYEVIHGLEVEGVLQLEVFEQLLDGIDQAGAWAFDTLFNRFISIGREIQKREQQKQDKVDRVMAALFRAGFHPANRSASGTSFMDSHAERFEALIKALRSLGLDPKIVQERVRSTKNTTYAECGVANPDQFTISPDEPFYSWIDTVGFAEFLATLLP